MQLYFAFAFGTAHGPPGWDDYNQDIPIDDNGISIPEYEFNQVFPGDKEQTRSTFLQYCNIQNLRVGTASPKNRENSDKTEGGYENGRSFHLSRSDVLAR